MRPLTRAQKLKIHGEPCRACGGLAGVCGHHAIARSISLDRDATDAVLPLCSLCHGAAHAGNLDVLSLLTKAEQHAAVDAAGSLSRAYEILTAHDRMAA